MSNPKIVTLHEADFTQKISQGTVLVDFWATWCGPCQMQLGVLDNLAASDRLPAGVTIAKVEIDENPQLAAQFEIMTVPTLMVFKNGKLANRMSGVHSVDQLLQAIQ